MFNLVSSLGSAKNIFALGGDQSYRHLRLKPSGTMIMCVAAGDAEEKGRMRLDTQSHVQVMQPHLRLVAPPLHGTSTYTSHSSTSASHTSTSWPCHASHAPPPSRAPCPPRTYAPTQPHDQAVDDILRRPSFKISVAEYKGKPSSETVEFQCETLQEVQAWVRAVEGVLSGLRDKRVGLEAKI